MVTESKRGSPGLCQKRAVITVPLWPPLYSGRRGCAALMEEKGSVEQGEGRTGYEKNTPQLPVRGGGDRAGRSAPGPGPHSPARRRGCLAGPRSWCSVLQREDSPSPSPPFCGSSLGGRERADSFPGSRVGQRQRGVRPHGLPPGCRRPGAGQGFLPWGWLGTLRCRGRPPRPAWETPAAAPRYRNRPQTPRHSKDLSVTPEPLCPWPWAPAPGPARWLTDLRHEPPFSPSPLTCHTDTTVPTRWSWCDHA